MKKALLVLGLLLLLSSQGLAATTYFVRNGNDSGTDSLRAALTTLADGDSIVFLMTTAEAGYSTGEAYPGLVTTEAGSNTWFRIIVNSGLPTITANNVWVKGSTQAGEANNTLGPEIEVRSNSTSYIDIFTIFNANNVTLEGMAINKGGSGSGFFGSNINITGSDNCEILGCYIGLTASGEGYAPCSSSYNSYYGVTISNSCNYNKIGNGTEAGRNIISGNYTGVYIGFDTTVSSNEVLGNYIGTTPSGEAALRNNIGVEISSSSKFNKIGNTTGGGNVISGNTIGNGVYLHGQAERNEVMGNLIGTDKNGTAPLKNYAGIYISGAGTNFNKIGDGASSGRNIISGNQNGIDISGTGANSNEVLGNYIGTDNGGTADLGNSNYGIYIRDSAQYNLIGGYSAGNTISGNKGGGVSINNAHYNEIKSNYIGTTYTGEAVLGNDYYGVGLGGGAQYNKIGDGTEAGKNTISGTVNTGVGIYIDSSHYNEVRGNRIGTNPGGTVDLGNTGLGINIVNGSQYNKIGSLEVGSKNIISGNDSGGLQITGTGTNSNEVIKNYIGTALSGTAALANGNGAGIVISNGAKYNKVWNGGSPGAFNLISGNSINSGVSIYNSGTDYNEVKGNYIGTTNTGEAALANSVGVSIGLGAKYNKIGAASERNLISGNTNYGIDISGSGTNSNEVKGNYIGTGNSGTADIGNGTSGIIIYDSAHYNRIGGSGAGEGNVISGNNDQGISIGAANGCEVAGNYIGTQYDGETTLGNSTNGILIQSGAQRNMIGGESDGAKNVIDANGNQGILITGTNTKYNEVLGNYIGVGTGGTADLGNAQSGIAITGTAESNYIGNGTFQGKNLISGNSQNGILIDGINTNSNEVLGNYIGTDKSGGVDLGNTWDGIYISGAAKFNQVGNTAGVGNVISGNNGDGICITGAGTNYNWILGNKIGTKANGLEVLGNTIGIIVRQGAQYVRIGDGTSAGRNIISGNDSFGVRFSESGGGSVTGSCEVLGNYIGTGIDGTTNVKNASYNVFIENEASNNRVGGNVIAYNDNASEPDGIRIADSITRKNVITQNSVFSNLGKGIKLFNGGNNQVASPEITTINYNDATGICQITGLATAEPGGTLELFKAQGGQGKTYLGSATIGGGGSFNLTVTGLISGDTVVATGTTANPETSEFSATKEVSITTAKQYQPDNMIATLESGVDYVGENIFNNDGTNQNKTTTSSSATYYVKIKNAGNTTDEVIVTGTASSGSWSVTYYDAKTGGSNITSQVIGSGWSTGVMTSAETKEIRVVVEYSGTTSSSKEVLVTSTSNTSNTFLDAVKAQTVFTSAGIDRFTVSAPASAIATVPFSTTITARDSAGNPVIAVIGATSLTVDTGTITPDSIAASAFSAGVWTGNITLGSPGGLTITVTNGTATGSAYVLVTNATREYTSADLGIPGMSITIPAGAATADVTVTASITTAPGAPPAGYSVGGQVFNIVSTPISTFLLPVMVTIPISGPLAAPKVQYWTGTAWSSDGIVIVSYTSTSLTFTTTHFTIFAPMAALPSNLVRFGPNPYNPNNGSGRFWYWLTADSDTSIYLIDLAGSIAWKQTYLSGTNGGKAGENNILYDGKTSWGDQLGQGVYIYKIVQGGKSIGGGKIAVIK
jgi:hypothetical protein